MARVTCRCGETLDVANGDAERVVCPRCNARIRIRRPEAQVRVDPPANDGFLRFLCPCGRRLKVRAAEQPKAGRCPDCGRVVPVPESAWTGGAGGPPADDPETRTEELNQDDVARLQRWAARHGVMPGAANSVRPGSTAPAPSDRDRAPHIKESQAYTPPAAAKVEVGLRICPRCGEPLHMSATVCRSCGAPTPKK